MSNGFTIKLQTFIIFCFIMIPALMLCILAEADFMFTLVLLIWLWMFLVSISNLKNHSALFSFLIAFFVFLMGRQFCYTFFDCNELYTFLDSTNTYTYVCIAISLIGIYLGDMFASGKIRFEQVRQRKPSFLESGAYGNNYRFACKIMFYFCYMFTLVYVAMRIVFVQAVGYLASYTDDVGGSGIPTIILWLHSFTPVALSLFLATKPEKKEVLLPAVLYELYAVLTVFTGQRYPFIGISMYLLVYWLIRNKEDGGWVKRYHYLAVVIAVPLLMIFTTAYDSIRIGEPFEFNSIAETLKEFFIDQGGSINTIRRTIYNADEIDDMKLVSFSSTYSTLFENTISRRLCNITVYSNNTIEHALKGHSLAHRLSYIAYGSGYLAGRGIGSSYIAELLHDFGVAGVFLGSIFYGIMLGKISRIGFTDKFRDGILLAMIYYLLQAPRGDFDSFIGGIFSLQSVIFFICIIGLSQFLGKMKGMAIVYENKTGA